MLAPTSRSAPQNAGGSRTHGRGPIRTLHPVGLLVAALSAACAPGATGSDLETDPPLPNAMSDAADGGTTMDRPVDAAAPSPTDGIKNGDETDVDCGGASAPKCAAGKLCAKADDCTSGACPSGTCASGKSCRAHFGGDTCGPGEVDDPARKHEDCCLSVRPGPEADYRLDKYLVTAGRMRAFVESVGPDVRGWARANRPLLPPEWAETWDASLPANEVDVVQMLGTGQGTAAYWNAPGRANGCYAKGMGAPTYWHPEDKLAQYAGDERQWTKDELDTKTMNCAPRALFAAFCAWDGGRLPTWPEWARAVRGTKTEAEWPFPWGTETNISARASYDRNYRWPLARAGMALGADGNPIDRAYEVAAPGRFPSGNGPFGHADLLGLVETFVSGNKSGANLGVGGIRQYAFQEAYYGKQAYGTYLGWKEHISHYAVGARCARPL